MDRPWRAGRAPSTPRNGGSRIHPIFSSSRVTPRERRTAMTCRRVLLFAIAAIALSAMPAAAQQQSITVFAAASMKNALDDVNAAFLKASGMRTIASYGASSALARQIEQGAPADIFASADLDWIDYSAQKKLIKNDTRVNLLGNRLVLTAPRDSKIDKLEIRQGFDLSNLVGDGRIA